ncbi:MAG: CSLREA domain-containing protein [Acidobacteriota bacterium]
MIIFEFVRRSFPSLLIVGLGMMLGFPSAGQAADIQVDTTDDVYHGNCILFCSLRDAILVSNSNGEDDTIHVPAGTYNLTIPGAGENGGLTGDLDIDSLDMVTIIGEGPGATIIDGNAIDRVLHIDMNSGSVFLTGLTIRGGLVNGASGGGIFNWNSTLIINSCEITGNHITGDDNNERGGGIFNEEGLLWMNDSMISFNSSEHRAGGLYIGPGSTTQLNRCTVNNNTALNAGAVYTEGTSYFYNVTFFDNTATGGADGVWVVGTSEFKHCTLYQIDIAEETIYCRAGGALTTLKNTIVSGTCNVEEANIDPVAGNVEWADTCFMGYGNYHSAGTATGLLHLSDFGFNGGGVQTFKLSASGVSDDYVFTTTHLLDEDARFTPRPVGPYGDSGAYELVPDEIFSHGFENKYTTGWSDTVR